MRCELVGGGMEDWWCIERLEHDGREWMAPVDGDPHSMQFMRSARPSDACIEGTSAEMLTLAYAINNGNSAAFKRCAAERYGDGYRLSSPRNSQVPAKLTREEAKELAADIITKLSALKTL